MIYERMYNSMENLLDSKEKMEELTKMISKLANRNHFYDILVKASNSQYHGTNETDEKDFYIKNFNRWKRFLATITPEELAQLKKQGSYDETIDELIAYLRRIPDVRTIKEIEDIYKDADKNDDLRRALNNYIWHSIGDGTGWTHVNSRYVHAKRSDYVVVSHRLYLNVDTRDIYKMANEIIKKCEERQIEYYFKFDSYGQRDDDLVIYTDTERLPQYLEILDEIMKEHPDMKERMGQPPFFTGKINDWIGYGSEPLPKNGKNRSFNGVRSACVEKAAKECLNEWYESNKNYTINYRNKPTSILKFLSVGQACEEYESMCRILNRRRDKSNETLISILGYDQKYIDSPAFKRSLVLGYKKVIEQYLRDRNAKIEPVKVPLLNNKFLSIDKNDVQNVLCLLAPYLYKNEAGFRKRFKEVLKKHLKEEDVDTDKFCFDLHAKQLFMDKQEEIKQQKDMYDKICKRIKELGYELPREKGRNERIAAYNMYLSKYVHEILEHMKNSKKQASHTGKQAEAKQTGENKVVGMTDEEITASKIKLGFIADPNEQTSYVEGKYRLVKAQIIKDLPIHPEKPKVYKK